MYGSSIVEQLMEATYYKEGANHRVLVIFSNFWVALWMTMLLFLFQHELLVA